MDLGILSVEKATVAPEDGPGAAAHQRCVEAYDQGGFVLHEGKSQAGVTEATVWGGRVSSSRRIVSADYGKIGPLVGITCQVLDSAATCTLPTRAVAVAEAGPEEQAWL